MQLDDKQHEAGKIQNLHQACGVCGCVESTDDHVALDILSQQFE